MHGRPITVVKGLVTFGGYGDDAGRNLTVTSTTVELNLYRVRLDGLHCPQHPVLEAKIPIVFQKHRTVARRKVPPAIIGRIRDMAAFLTAS